VHGGRDFLYKGGGAGQKNFFTIKLFNKLNVFLTFIEKEEYKCKQRRESIPFSWMKKLPTSKGFKLPI
jgi:hypothetical protein